MIMKSYLAFNWNKFAGLVIPTFGLRTRIFTMAGWTTIGVELASVWALLLTFRCRTFNRRVTGWG